MAKMNEPARRIRIVLDIPTLKNENSQLIQQYHDNDFFDFIAIGDSSKFTQLGVDFENKVLTIEKKSQQGNRIEEEFAFPYEQDKILEIASHRDLTAEELTLLFIAQTLTFIPDPNCKVILVTQRKKLINYQKYFASIRLPEFTIFDPDEARLFIDLYLKRQNKYFIRPSATANKGLWYLFSVKTKFPQFQLPWSITVYSQDPFDYEGDMGMQMLGSISRRMTDMLKAIDEIGFCFYEGSNNDTMADTLYHLNYWITLYSGILDALAWVSLGRYNILPAAGIKVGLRSSENKATLAELYERNSKVRGVIESSQKIIELVYDPRNVVIHKEMLQGTRLSDIQAKINLNMVEIKGDFLDHVRALQPVVKRGINKAGLYESDGHYLLEPYRFVRFASRLFIDFLNRYMAALDYEEYLLKDQSLKEKIEANQAQTPSDFDHASIKFQEYALGY